MVDEQAIARLRERIVETFQPLLDPAQPVALVDFPDSINSGDHAIWLGEKAFLDACGIKTAYTCSVGTYNKAALAAAVGAGPILMHGGGNFGDIYTLYHNFRLQVLRDFPDNPVIVFPQTVMFFADEALRTTVDQFASHGRVTLAARDVLSFHVLEKAFAGAARVVLAPDMAYMLGPLRRSCEPAFDIVWISRTDIEGVHGAGLSAIAGMPALQTVAANLGPFEDRIGVAASAEVAGNRLLVSDWYRMGLADQQSLSVYDRQTFDQRSRFWVERAVRLMSAGRVVVTDRLHGHILCTLAGIPHVLLNNSYGKNISFFESWSRPSGLCRLAATPAHAWALAQQMLGQAPPPPTAFKTDVPRWANPDSLHESWKYRSERAATFVAPGAKLLDIGCGKMMIEQYLPDGCAYIPHDVVARDERTRVHDLNNNDRPSFEGATHISVLGVMEYLNDADAFWAWLAQSGARVILSYVPLAPSFPAERRRAMGWFNDFSGVDVVAMAQRAGFSLVSEEAVPPDTLLFVFDPQTPSAAAKPASGRSRKTARGASGRSSGRASLSPETGAPR